MPRPKKCRRICALPRCSSFGPLEGAADGRVEMAVEHWKRKMLVVCSLCINLGLLCYFKYTNFFYEMG